MTTFFFFLGVVAAGFIALLIVGVAINAVHESLVSKMNQWTLHKLAEAERERDELRTELQELRQLVPAHYRTQADHDQAD